MVNFDNNQLVWHCIWRTVILFILGLIVAVDTGWYLECNALIFLAPQCIASVLSKIVFCWSYISINGSTGATQKLSQNATLCAVAVL